MSEEIKTIPTAEIPPVASPKPAAKTQAQLDLEKRQKERLEQKRIEKEAAAALTAKHEKYKEAVGKTFAEGSVEAKVTAFEPSKELGGVYSECYLVNFGNPYRSDYVPCEVFLTQFKLKE
jgi:hypothetical protein